MTNFSKFIRTGNALKTAFTSMSALVKESIAAGFVLVKSKSRNTIIHESKAGNAQLIFRNGEDTLFVRISENALDAISGGATPKELPVYDVTLYPNNDPTQPSIGNMLVIGTTGGENPDWAVASEKDLEKLFKVVPVTTD